ncbi:cupin domain-containing protein [bacterium]|nr:cupin domain-containing protein [bacterium]
MNKTPLNLPHSKVTELEKLVNYQPNSIVSSTLIDKKVGTITLFAFDQGQGLSEHSAPYDAFVFLLDGKAEFSILGKPYPAEKGGMLIMPANDPHAVKAITPFKMMLVMIRE